MLKKLFVVFLVCSFVSNLIALDVMALNTKTVREDKKPTLTNGISVPISDQYMDYAQNSEFATEINLMQEILKNIDMYEAPYLADILNNYYGNTSIDSIIEEYRFLIDLYSQEIADSTDRNDEITPGCLSDYYVAFLWVFGVTPLLSFFALESLDGEVKCFWSWGFASLTTFTWGLTRWTDYRICAEKNSDNTDQETINQLQQDKDFLEQMAFTTVSIAFGLGRNCSRGYLDLLKK